MTCRSKNVDSVQTDLVLGEVFASPTGNSTSKCTELTFWDLHTWLIKHASKHWHTVTSKYSQEDSVGLCGINQTVNRGEINLIGGVKVCYLFCDLSNVPERHKNEMYVKIFI